MAKKHFRTIRQHFWEYAQISLLYCGMLLAFPALLLLICGFGRVSLLLLLLGCIAFFLFAWGLTLLRGLRFLLILHRQIRQELPFETGPLKHLEAAYTHSWLSENWLIHAGYIALHRSQIANVTYALPRVDRACPSGLCDLIITTVHGRRYRCRMTGPSVKQVIRWHQKNAIRKESPC